MCYSQELVDLLVLSIADLVDFIEHVPVTMVIETLAIKYCCSLNLTKFNLLDYYRSGLIRQKFI